MATFHCPTCKRAVPERAKNPTFPFCNDRCRAVDLGRWLGEEYRVADRHAEDDEDGTPVARAPEPGGEPRQ